MASIAKLMASMSVLGPSGFGPFDLLHALAVTNWVGPFGVSIPNGTSLQPLIVIGLGGISAVKAFLVTSSQTVLLNYDNSTIGITLTANGFHLFSDTNLTAISLSNNSGVSADVIYMAAGD